MKKTRLHSLLLTFGLAAASLAANHASAQNLVLNGDFESPAEVANSLNDVTGTGLPDWTGSTITGAHEYIINGNIQDFNGDYYGVTSYGQQYLGLNAIYRNSFHSIESQSVSNLIPGATYALTLYIADLDGATDPNIGVTVEPNATGTGTSIASTTFTAPVGGPYGATTGVINFVPETLNFVSTTGVIDFNINNQSKTGVIGIDNVSLTLVSVPEPTTTAALLLGTAALVGFALCRRNQASQIA